MPLRLLQLQLESAARGVVAVRDDGAALRIDGANSVYELAMIAIKGKTTLQATVDARLSADAVDLAGAERELRLLPPIDHPDDAHLYLTGTGLTHLGSAKGRDKMHRDTSDENISDSLRMFHMGLEGGKPAHGGPGVQPEWFYKGSGACIVGTGKSLCSPAFARDGGEEPEIAGIYIIDDEGVPRRLGFCLANEFSDHVTERGNYLWLAHSKLRPAALGPELLSDVPADIRGVSRIRRDGHVIWEKPFLTGEANMSHSIRNLEHHHFKYELFRQPGDVHVHFFGTATLSFADDLRTQPGDEFEIEAAPFRFPLRNRLVTGDDPGVEVVPL
jgi:hypothetical protein